MTGDAFNLRGVVVLGASLVAVSSGCGSPTSRASCDDLRGVWRAEDSGARWMLLDHGATLEGYPLFPDAALRGLPSELETAPRVIDLGRDGELRGDVKRRFMRGSDACLAKAPVRVTACTGSTLELVLADPAPPPSVAPCTWGTAAPSRRERWHRE